MESFTFSIKYLLIKGDFLIRLSDKMKIDYD